ncbi:ricin-type beta-trefoil lectin domain protein [Kribbella sp. DT2]|uniref:ricin-type beta-trefoil lectin domain protein n=1 Tax=Kribbella sp. DT2 TaxID=3393427 RepID=UPI003CE84C65
MRRTLRRLRAALFGVLLVGGLCTGPPAHAAPAESNGGVRIMPLGDSITDGLTVKGGYRIKLWQQLVATNHPTDFVGSRVNGPAELGDHDNEGHPGWRIDQIDTEIVGWLRTYAPRTILLHIGTNDLNQNYDVANAPARLSKLIDKIRTTQPNVELFVAQISPVSRTVEEGRIKAFNAAIPGIVAQKGPKTHVVDIHSALTLADLSEDGVHLNAGGYTKMGDRWYSALAAVPGSLQPAAPPVGKAATLVNPNAQRCLDVAGASTTPGAQVVINDCHGRPNQVWTRTAAGEFRVFGDRCLDVNGNGTANGTKVQIWTCSGSPAQRFTVSANGGIVGAGSGKCLDVTAAGTANATPVQIYQCNYSTAQVWDPRG